MSPSTLLLCGPTGLGSRPPSSAHTLSYSVWPIFYLVMMQCFAHSRQSIWSWLLCCLNLTALSVLPIFANQSFFPGLIQTTLPWPLLAICSPPLLISWGICCPSLLILPMCMHGLVCLARAGRPFISFLLNPFKEHWPDPQVTTVPSIRVWPPTHRKWIHKLSKDLGRDVI